VDNLNLEKLPDQEPRSREKTPPKPSVPESIPESEPVDDIFAPPDPDDMFAQYDPNQKLKAKIVRPLPPNCALLFLILPSTKVRQKKKKKSLFY